MKKIKVEYEVSSNPKYCVEGKNIYCDYYIAYDGKYCLLFSKPLGSKGNQPVKCQECLSHDE